MGTVCANYNSSCSPTLLAYDPATDVLRKIDLTKAPIAPQQQLKLIGVSGSDLVFSTEGLANMRIFIVRYDPTTDSWSKKGAFGSVSRPGRGVHADRLARGSLRGCRRIERPPDLQPRQRHLGDDHARTVAAQLSGGQRDRVDGSRPHRVEWHRVRALQPHPGGRRLTHTARLTAAPSLQDPRYRHEPTHSLVALHRPVCDGALARSTTRERVVAVQQQPRRLRPAERRDPARAPRRGRNPGRGRHRAAAAWRRPSSEYSPPVRVLSVTHGPSVPGGDLRRGRRGRRPHPRGAGRCPEEARPIRPSATTPSWSSAGRCTRTRTTASTGSRTRRSSSRTCSRPRFRSSESASARRCSRELRARGVRPASAPEIGWLDVSLTPAGATDPVLGALPSRATVFQWHHYTFDIPHGGDGARSQRRLHAGVPARRSAGLGHPVPRRGHAPDGSRRGPTRTRTSFR